MRDDRVYLRHIHECLSALERYTAEGREVFFRDRKTQKAILRELQGVAESTQQLYASLKERRGEIPWVAIAGFRNVLVHDYLGLNLERVWSIVERDVPTLRLATEAMLHELGA